MKKALFYGVIGVLVMTLQMPVNATISAVNIKPRSDLSTTQTAQFLNIETPFRCSVKSFGDQEITKTIALKKGDFELTFFDSLDALPRFEVNGFSFKSKPVDEALQDLLDEAEITVYTEDGYYPELDAEDVYGELSEVVAELTEAGGVFYQYDNTRKELYLSRQGRFLLQLPDNRMVMLAMLDALRGAGIYNVTPNWKTNTLLLTLTQDEKEMIQSLIDSIVRDSYLLLADTRVYQLSPQTAGANWQDVITSFGPDRVYSAKNGLIGKVITLGHHKRPEDLMSALDDTFTIAPISQGVAIVPNGWKMRFDIGQCTIPGKASALSILMSARIKSPEMVETDVTLNSREGEVTAFNTLSAIDNELAILGVPTFNETDSNTQELFAILKLRLIRLVKEK